MHNFKELKVWLQGISLSRLIFEITKAFPSEHKFSLDSQMFRSAISIPSNIAEGCSRKSEKDFRRFLDIALGSSFELETQIIIAKEVDLVTQEQYSELIYKTAEIQKMLNGLIKCLNS
ncbi:hypothetical protein Pedsa_3415 [Pseudopedobacter saltans DSM 12145]|uniref:Four helix bundle protein n=1 Tax=Pseudopedobacter saltans (strain ATCC 51119 / DSM 12145 / JCM 21818 / CCUG 39354 / LMG 10337 / NBRC 100064 / NCIMB 13643) TaxID=762903 RepID=F0SDG6_PSESL|nr:four helix bundle protein [Pseudopedobacter saltans]ADY53949.1 hypothetical protein Pedsa_3415 [Pseudopedobacter saltans DSM 12145]